MQCFVYSLQTSNIATCADESIKQCIIALEQFKKVWITGVKSCMTTIVGKKDRQSAFHIFKLLFAEAGVVRNCP